MKKVNDYQPKHYKPTYRTWKSKKQWIYGTGLAAVLLGAGVSVVPVMAETSSSSQVVSTPQSTSTVEKTVESIVESTVQELPTASTVEEVTTTETPKEVQKSQAPKTEKQKTSNSNEEVGKVNTTETNQAKSRPVGNEPEQIAKLQENYNHYLSLNKNNYTEESWNGLMDEGIINQTLMILNNHEIQAPPTPANMLNMYWDWAFDQLIEKPVAPQINTSKLQEAIMKAETKLYENTWVSTEQLQNAINLGYKIQYQEDPMPTQEEVDTATQRIYNEMDKLIDAPKFNPVYVRDLDRTRINQLNDKFDALIESDYTPESWESFLYAMNILEDNHEGHGDHATLIGSLKSIYNDNPDRFIGEEDDPLFVEGGGLKAIQQSYYNYTADDVQKAFNLLVLIDANSGKPEESKVNKDILQKFVDEATKRDTSKSTDESKKTFDTALEEAKKVLKDEKVSQKQVDDAGSNLDSAMKSLKDKPTKIDTSKLQEALIKVNKKLNEDIWDSAEELQYAIFDAEHILDGEEYEPGKPYTQAQVDAVTKRLYEEMDKLVKKEIKNPVYIRDIDRSKINEAHDRYHALVEKDYTPESWEAFLEDLYKDSHGDSVGIIPSLDGAYELAPDRYIGEEDDPNFVENGGLKAYMQEGWDQLANKVLNAMNLLVPINKKPDENKVNKDALQKLVDEANKKDTSKSTDESKKSFDTALEEANKILKDKTATQKQVDDAGGNLDSALKGLRDKPTEKPGENKVNKDGLQKLVEEANKKDTSKSTDESKKSFDTSLEEAKKILKDDKATQKQVDDAKVKLDSAMKGLKDKLVTKPDPSEKTEDKKKNTNDSIVKSDTSKKADKASKVSKKELPKTGENSLLTNILIALGLSSMAGASILKGKKNK